MAADSFINKINNARKWVYPAYVEGAISRVRGKMGVVLLLFFLVLPHIRINGNPLLLLDITHRRFMIFGTVFWPQDVWFLFFVLFAFVIALLLFTALYGRVWCGYACPQTVFLHHVFLRIERWIEGDRGVRMRLLKTGLDTRAWGRKIAKHIAFIAVSSVVAHTFLAFFMESSAMLHAILNPSMAYATEIGFTTGFTLLFYLNFAFFREQFCSYLCPYARFQSAMLDEHSLIVAYDAERGESRGFDKKEPEQYGDCIDCKKCVIVCPQGIDIRDGLQLDCIHCGLCADACTPIMQKLDRPTGLIRYASEAELDHKPTKYVRTRTIVYTVLLVISIAVTGYLLATRKLVELTLVRPAGVLYGTSASNNIYNRFQLRVSNKDDVVRHVFVAPVDVEHYQLRLSENPIALQPGSSKKVELFVEEIKPDSTEISPTFSLRITPGNGEEAQFVEGKMLRPSGGTQ